MNLQNLELEKYVKYFKPLQISLVYSFDYSNGQLDNLNLF